MPELEGKTVLITGSGSLGGIGADTALLFAQQGAEVLVSGRETERGQRVVETIVQAGGTARFLLADLANLDDVARLADEAGDVDVLVNNAAGYKLESSLRLTAEDFSLMYDTIVRAAFFLVQKLAPRMVARRSGSIVNVSSTAASVALPGGCHCTVRRRPRWIRSPGIGLPSSPKAMYGSTRWQLARPAPTT